MTETECGLWRRSTECPVMTHCSLLLFMIVSWSKEMYLLTLLRAALWCHRASVWWPWPAGSLHCSVWQFWQFCQFFWFLECKMCDQQVLPFICFVSVVLLDIWITVSHTKEKNTSFNAVVVSTTALECLPEDDNFCILISNALTG